MRWLGARWVLAGLLALVGAPFAGSAHADDVGPLAISPPGGPTQSSTTSTTTHTTLTRFDLADVTVYSTRLTGVVGGTVVYDQTVSDAPGSPAFQAAEQQARAAMLAAGAGAIAGPTLVSSQQTSAAMLVTESLNHEEVAPLVTTTTFGGYPFGHVPGADEPPSLCPQGTTIFIGENQATPFVVACGTLNVNTNVHTDRFVDQTYQTTITNTSHYELTANQPASVTVVAVGDAATPVTARPRFAG